MIVRPATTADAAGVARVHVRAWQQAYAHLVPTGALAALDPADRVERWEATIASDANAVWVALDGEDVIGWISTTSGDDGFELEGLYVLAAWHGSGAGQSLLEAALGEAPAHLWIAADNLRAGAFYRRNGFARDGGESTYELAGTPVAIVRMVR